MPKSKPELKWHNEYLSGLSGITQYSVDVVTGPTSGTGPNDTIGKKYTIKKLKVVVEVRHNTTYHNSGFVHLYLYVDKQTNQTLHATTDFFLGSGGWPTLNYENIPNRFDILDEWIIQTDDYGHADDQNWISVREYDVDIPIITDGSAAAGAGRHLTNSLYLACNNMSASNYGTGKTISAFVTQFFIDN